MLVVLLAAVGVPGAQGKKLEATEGGMSPSGMLHARENMMHAKIRAGLPISPKPVVLLPTVLLATLLPHDFFVHLPCLS